MPAETTQEYALMAGMCPWRLKAKLRQANGDVSGLPPNVTKPQQVFEKSDKELGAV